MGPKWPFLLMYGSHDMRHTGFPQVDGGQRDPRDLGHIFFFTIKHLSYYVVNYLHLNSNPGPSPSYALPMNPRPSLPYVLHTEMLYHIN